MTVTTIISNVSEASGSATREHAIRVLGITPPPKGCLVVDAYVESPHWLEKLAGWLGDDDSVWVFSTMREGRYAADYLNRTEIRYVQDRFSVCIPTSEYLGNKLPVPVPKTFLEEVWEYYRENPRAQQQVEKNAWAPALVYDSEDAYPEVVF